MEITEEVKTYRVKMICDKCKEGRMIPIGTMLMTTPVKFPHKCDKCNGIEHYSEQYPKVIYKEIGNEEGSSNNH
jgi:hypothetical protein